VAISTIWVAPPKPCAVPGDTDTLVLSEPGRLNLKFYRGDSGRFTVRVQMPNGDLVPITDAAWDCDVRSDVGVEPALASLDVTPVPPESPYYPYAVEVVITSEDSTAIADGIPDGELGVWDLQMLLGGETITILAGYVVTSDDVSRT